MRRLIFLIVLCFMYESARSQEFLTCSSQTVHSQGIEKLNQAVEHLEEAVATLHSINANIAIFQTLYQTQSEVSMITSRNCGVEDETIPDSAMTSSGYWQYSDEIRYAAFEGRLNNANFWHRARDDAHPWLQIDLGTPSKVTGVVTQGRPHETLGDWVTEFKIQYGNDANSMNFLNYNEKDIVFPGNTDRNSPKINMFPLPIEARYIRFVCEAWSREPVLRVEVLGCH